MQALLNEVFLKKIIYSFARAFFASLLTFSIGLANAPNWSFSKSAGVAAIVAAVTAGIRAVQHLIEKSPTPG